MNVYAALGVVTRVEGQPAPRTTKRPARAPGLSDTELGLRLRYEIRREFAPYIGVNWVKSMATQRILHADEVKTPMTCNLSVFVPGSDGTAKQRKQVGERDEEIIIGYKRCGFDPLRCHGGWFA